MSTLRFSEQILTPEQKLKFEKYFPEKVHKTERNICIIVAGTQLCMMLVTMQKEGGAFSDPMTARYFWLYAMLFAATVCAFPIHAFLVKKKHYTAYFWMRRGYVSLLFLWVIAMSLLDEANGMGIVIYCYLAPTLAAVMLLPPLEGCIIFGGAWMLLMIVLSNVGSANLTATMINSGFTTVLALFISVRGYRSMAITFRDREIIDKQYEEIQQANVLLNQMASTDQLTGLYNRHYLMETVKKQFDESKEQKLYTTFLMLDIDCFKQYNDTYGHLKGDNCLRNIGSLLKEFSQQHGTTAVRYGGEEFLVLKIHNQCAEEDLAAELQNKIAEADIKRTDVESGRVTVSIGVWSGELQELESIETALKYADRALYDAKRSGRNCTCDYCSKRV